MEMGMPVPYRKLKRRETANPKRCPSPRTTCLPMKINIPTRKNIVKV